MCTVNMVFTMGIYAAQGCMGGQSRQCRSEGVSGCRLSHWIGSTWHMNKVCSMSEPAWLSCLAASAVPKS